jgi:ZIP family zinc transporter
MTTDSALAARATPVFGRGLDGRRARIVGVLLISATAASLVGFWAAERVNGDVLGLLLAFAAGAVLAMLADTLLPEAFRGGGRITSLATTGGFLVASLLARL